MTTAMATSVTAPIAKPSWQSKTIWLNVFTIALAVLMIMDPALFGIDPKWLAFIAGVLNIGVRFLTDGRISLMGN